MAERDQGVGTSEDQASRWSSRRLLSKAMRPIRFFSSAAAAPRARRPTDLVLLITSVIGIGIALVLAPDPGDSGSTTTTFLRSLPGLFGWFWEIAYVLVFVWAAILLGAPLVSRGRLRLARDQWLALIVASVGSLLLAGDWSTMLDGLTSSGPPPVFPAVRIALITAILVTTSPHLGMPSRRAGRLFLALGILASIALGAVQPVGVIAGLSLGTAAATLDPSALRLTRWTADAGPGCRGARQPRLRNGASRARQSPAPGRGDDVGRHARWRHPPGQGLRPGRLGWPAPLEHLVVPLVSR